MTSSPNWAEISNTLSYEMLWPFSCSKSMSCLCLVLANTDISVYTPNGVSWSFWCVWTCIPSLYLAKQLYCYNCDITRSDFDVPCCICNLISEPCLIIHTNWRSDGWRACSMHPSSNVLLKFDCVEVCHAVASQQPSPSALLHHICLHVSRLNPHPSRKPEGHLSLIDELTAARYERAAYPSVR